MEQNQFGDLNLFPNRDAYRDISGKFLDFLRLAGSRAHVVFKFDDDFCMRPGKLMRVLHKYAQIASQEAAELDPHAKGGDQILEHEQPDTRVLERVREKNWPSGWRDWASASRRKYGDLGVPVFSLRKGQTGVEVGDRVSRRDANDTIRLSDSLFWRRIAEHTLPPEQQTPYGLHLGGYLWGAAAYASQKGVDGKFSWYMSGWCSMYSGHLATAMAESFYNANFPLYGRYQDDSNVGRWLDHTIKWRKMDADYIVAGGDLLFDLPNVEQNRQSTPDQQAVMMDPFTVHSEAPIVRTCETGKFASPSLAGRLTQVKVEPGEKVSSHSTSGLLPHHENI